jgi:anti-anti-sigma factor
LPFLAHPRPESDKHLFAEEALFDVEIAEDGGVFLIRVKGELDLARCPDLERALAESEESGARWILLDLDELTFIDAAGLHALLAASRRSAGSGERLRFTRGRGDVAEMFRLTAFDQTLPFLRPDALSVSRNSAPAPEGMS